MAVAVETPGATCTRFAFAIDEGRRNDERKNRRRAAVEYLLELLDLADVVDEWSDGSSRWIVVEVEGTIATPAARQIARDCPRYVPRSFAVDRTP